MNNWLFLNLLIFGNLFKDLNSIKIKSQLNMGNIVDKTSLRNEIVPQKQKQSSALQISSLLSSQFSPKFKILTAVLITLIFTVTSFFLFHNSTRQFCIISYREDSSNIGAFTSHLIALEKQTFKNWRAVYFVEGADQELQKRNNLIGILNLKQKVVVKRGEHSSTFKIYSGVMRECQRESTIFLLNQGEELTGDTALETLHQKISQDHATLVSVPYLQQNETISPQKDETLAFERDDYFKDNVIEDLPDVALLTNITENLRIFPSFYFRMFPYWYILDDDDVFYNSTSLFVMAFLEMSKASIVGKLIELDETDNSIKFNIKLPWEISNGVTFLEFPLFKKNGGENYVQIGIDNDIEEVNMIGRNQKFFPIEIYTFWSRFISGKYPKFLHKKVESIPFWERNFSVQPKIPKKIHQIWIGGKERYSYKKLFASTYVKYMPDYDYRLWGDKDLTEQNFPKTLKYILKIKQIQKTVTVNKNAVIADIMRLEILYNHGGFYCDTNVQAFKSFDSLRRYPLVTLGGNSGRTQGYIQTALMGSIPKHPILENSLESQNLDGLILNTTMVNLDTGPSYWSQIMTIQEVYFNAKILPIERVHGCNPFFDRRYMINRCRATAEYSSEMRKTEGIQIYSANPDNIFPCSQKYRILFAFDHLQLGGSWTAGGTKLNH